MDLHQLIRKQTDIAFVLAKHVLQTEAKGSNLMFSPLSIHVVLSMITAGSKGPTLDQLLCFLMSESSDQLDSFSSKLVSVVSAVGSPAGGPILSFATGVWLDKSLPLKSSFKQVVDNVYNAACNLVDFQNKAVQVAGEVNLWAEKETSGVIKEVLPPGSVDASARLIFTNALKKKQIVSAYDGFKVLGLPYKQGEDKRRFSMYFFLPDAKDGLHALLEKASSEPGFLETHVPSQPAEVGEFRIPRFKISFGLKASEVLKRLGLKLPFSSEGEVNEEGTEAAAATSGVIVARAFINPRKIDFAADHPFLFLVREDETGVVLFIGNVLNPLEY
ncbi:Serpin-ZX [Hibiscus syriacus]|uniref:Serpin-ZX n=1 Tax=Hibiscus syriacus TaxID=106335 RepID=A0A6A3CGT1_HIBSY|nr:Serpin-ZX [Hibiscus syriacus]